MINIASYKLDLLPFDLVVVQEILYADGPILSHIISMENDYLKYLVDFDNDFNRYIIFKVTKQVLYNYLSGGVSLRQIIIGLASDFAFLVDQDANEMNKHVSLFNLFALPNEYLPDERSYYTLGLPTYYDNYLRSFSYIQKLREQAYVFKLEATDKEHDKTVSSKEAGSFLINITKSIENYIDFKATNKYKNTIIDRTRLNKTVNQIKAYASPRIADTSYHSFEVSLAIDTIRQNAIGASIYEWRNELIDGYKNDVLDIDFSKDVDADVILDRFPDSESRKKIFEPFIKILENRAINLSVNSYNKNFERNYQNGRPKESFKSKILPQLSVEEVIEAENKKIQIYTAVFKFPEGSNISSLKKSELLQNLLFTQEGTEQTIPLNFSIEHNGTMIQLKEPIECNLMINPTGNILLYNSKLDLNAEGTHIDQVIDAIKNQFTILVNEKLENPESADEKTSEIERLIGV